MTSENPGITETREESLADGLQAARDLFATEIRQARGGVQAARAYSARVDNLLVRIMSQAGPQPDSPVALVALGGYGRRQLCLGSDIGCVL